MYRQLPGHRHLRDLSSSAHGQVEELAAPLRLAAHRNLRRFHQQKPQQHVALLADVSQSATIAAGFFCRNQTHIAGDLFPAVKTFRRSDHQLEGQCRGHVRPRQTFRSRSGASTAASGLWQNGHGASKKRSERFNRRRGTTPRGAFAGCCGPVAQLDRASDFGSEGWGFDSLRGRQNGDRRGALQVFLALFATFAVKSFSLCSLRPFSAISAIKGFIPPETSTALYSAAPPRAVPAAPAETPQTSYWPSSPPRSLASRSPRRPST